MAYNPKRPILLNLRTFIEVTDSLRCFLVDDWWCFAGSYINDVDIRMPFSFHQIKSLL